MIILAKNGVVELLNNALKISGGVGNGDELGDLTGIAKVGHFVTKLGEWDFDRDEINFGVGLTDELDEIVAVAVDRNETSTALAWFELHGFGGATTVYILAVNKTASFLVDDFVAKLLCNLLVIIVVFTKKTFDLGGGVGGGGVKSGFDLGFDEREIEHMLIFGFTETEIVFDNLNKGFLAAVNTADFEMAIELGGYFLIRNRNALLASEFGSIGIILGFGKGRALVFGAKLLNGGFVKLTTRLAFNRCHTATIKHEIIRKTNIFTIYGGNW